MRVVVVGAGLAGLVAAHRAARLGADVTVLDAAERAGGLLRSERADGRLVERAANGFLDDAPATLALARELGLEAELVRAAPASSERFLAHRGRLVAIPATPPRVLTTPLLSMRGKLRFARELRVPPAPPGVEESVAAFVARRFGPEALPAADALASGVFAGDPARLSLDAAFPRVRALERAHGSVLRALLHARRGPQRGATRPALATFREGMETLPRTLAAALPRGALALAEPARRIARGERGLVVETPKRALDADRVLVALPPALAARVVPGLGTAEAPSAPVAVAALAWPAERATGARGFGWLAPEAEGRFALGGVFESNLFPGRAREGEVLVRAIVGGARHPERATLPDAEVRAGVAEDARALGVARGEPSWARVVRPGAIPQLALAHARIVAAARDAEARLPGLAFLGAGWSTVAVNGLVAEAEAVAGARARGDGLVGD